MALYAIGDTHLSLNSEKPMDVFGGLWEGYVEKLEEGFSVVAEEDTVVICGDVSWGMSLKEAEKDFAFLDRLPGGRKLLLKGNHDYWWTTAAKMERFFEEKGFHTLHLLHNNCCFYGETALCGTRGWMQEENGDCQNEKMVNREASRLECSLKAAGDAEQKICFLHYPPCYQGYTAERMIRVMEEYGVQACYYGHLHGASRRLAIEGQRGNISYRLISADHLNFKPEKILE